MTTEEHPLSLLMSGLLGALIGFVVVSSNPGSVIGLLFLAIGIVGTYTAIVGGIALYRMNKKD